jgi:hypothetical protein
MRKFPHHQKLPTSKQERKREERGGRPLLRFDWWAFFSLFPNIENPFEHVTRLSLSLSPSFTTGKIKTTRTIERDKIKTHFSTKRKRRERFFFYLCAQLFVIYSDREKERTDEEALWVYVEE